MAASLQKSAYGLEGRDVLNEFSVSEERGLTVHQVEVNRGKFGKNEIPVPPGQERQTHRRVEEKEEEMR